MNNKENMVFLKNFKMNFLNKQIFYAIISLFFFAGALCESTENTSKKKVNPFGPSPNEVSTTFWQEESSTGDMDAGGELIFAQALRASAEQDLHDVISRSNDLLNVGAARAYTTLAFLLSHNLTEPQLSSEDRLNKAMSYYVTAAVKGDPVAQIVAGKAYLDHGECMSSVNYYHKAAAFAIKKIPEMEILNPSLVRHIWDEDMEIPIEAFPTQEQLDFFENGAYYGDPDAAMNAASLLIAGPDNIQRDLVKGELYLKQAARGNITNAMVYLAQMYIRGVMEGSDELALKLLEKALKYGNNLAHAGLGRLYMEGRAGLEKNIPKALSHLKKGVESGNLDAFYQLGRLYSLYEKYGSMQEAVNLWQIPAMIGHVHSAWCLAEYYHDTLVKRSTRTILSPRSTEVSLKLCENAVSFYRTVALAGEWRHFFDEAFTDYTSGTKGAALMKYLLLSDLGYKAAHINAARILDEEGNNIYAEETSAKEQAFEMWQRTAKSGNPKGHVRMADHLYYGTIGKLRDYVGAAEHYKKASIMGDSEGTFSLALVTERGEGVEQDIHKAEQIYRTLAERDPDAEVPVAIALARLKLFNFVKQNFKTDLYAYDMDLFAANSINLFKNIFSIQWDIWIIILLSFFILVNLHSRYV